MGLGGGVASDVKCTELSIGPASSTLVTQLRVALNAECIRSKLVHPKKRKKVIQSCKSSNANIIVTTSLSQYANIARAYQQFKLKYIILKIKIALLNIK